MTRWLRWPSGTQLVLLSTVLLIMHSLCWWHAGRIRNPYSLYYQPDWAAIGRLATQRRLQSQERIMRELTSLEARGKVDKHTAFDSAPATIRFPPSRTSRHRLCVGILYEGHDVDRGHRSNVIPLTVSELLLRTAADDSSIAMSLFCQEGAACDRLDGRISKLLTLRRLDLQVSPHPNEPVPLHLAALSYLTKQASCDYHLILDGHLFVGEDWAPRLLNRLELDYGAHAPDWFAARLLTQLERSYNWDSLDMMALLGVGLSLCIVGAGLAALLHWSFLQLLRGSRRLGSIGRWAGGRTFNWDDFARPSIITVLILLMGTLVVPLIVGKPTIMFLTSGFHMYDPSACGTGGFLTVPTKKKSPTPPACREHSLAILYHHTNSEHLLDLLLGEEEEEEEEEEKENKEEKMGKEEKMEKEEPPNQQPGSSSTQADDFDRVDYVRRRPLPRGGGVDEHNISLSEGMDRVLAGLVAYNYAHGYRTPLGILLPNLFQHDLPTYGPARGRPEEIYSFSFPEV